MAARPGEENVATLFGDVHYFYSPASVKPRHHRFDKGSYVYLFENAGESRCRIEIANNPGTDDQDAFHGFLDQAHVRYSYKQHCAVSLTVAESVDQSEWHLPTYDPRNENKYHYKLHSLDIYFWTQHDALQFVNGVRRVLPSAQVEVLDEPGPPPQQPAEVSAVVQRLESAAISDPQYSNGPVSSQSTSQSSVGGRGDASAVSSEAPSISMPPPPPPPQPASFAPMAYNPAAPAAPEAIRHREKTPPPDEDPLNPLAVAVAYDYRGQPFTPGIPPPSHFPPSAITSPGLAPPQFAAPPVHPGIHRATTMPAQGLPSPGQPGTYEAGFPASPGLPPPPASQPPVASQGLPGPPAVGYPNYSYSQPGYTPSGPNEYSIHQQVYRPTEAERAHAYQPKKDGKGKFEENAGRFERGVTGMLKKFEKKFG
ncbi:hypothetical protein Trco_002347 [Trichoderma cornu-damae]|uniref:RNA recognition motif-containing protein n=1 Tax=Trichoderma cornu-damae TaxID=654480 RepID=A0A9P8QPQ2_9HYPO|nr:hypothetical protein Trco_002347 [Trichoderma cornu-damae]